jgi:hypothetical protein
MRKLLEILVIGKPVLFLCHCSSLSLPSLCTCLSAAEKSNLRVSQYFPSFRALRVSVQSANFFQIQIELFPFYSKICLTIS